MSRIATYFCSTIGRKQTMAIAGLGLCGFVFMHATGNMLLLKSPEAYNRYSHALVTNPLILLAEAGLVAMFLGHIVFGIAMTIRNYGARPVNYAKSAGGTKSTSLTTKLMAAQGVVILFYLINHILMFKYGPEYDVTYGADHMRDLFKLVYETFQKPAFVTWYIGAVVLLAFHLSHGLYSAIQTLGLNHPAYMPKVKWASILYGLFVGAMFISQPLYMFFIFKG